VLDLDAREVHSAIKGDVRLLCWAATGRPGDSAAVFGGSIEQGVVNCQSKLRKRSGNVPVQS
jgi:hypothetical protein